MALAGGVSVTFPQERGYLYQEGAIASADGHCRPFDADARGTVFGSGCGVVLLKRLEEAVADGDPIYATIKGSAVNNDGSDKVSYMAPSVNGQADAIALALALADAPADSISYVEAHGTGTPLGDPIEVAGLTQAFEVTTDKKQFCGLGAAKSNFGHLEAAAGVTGLIKTALALQNRTIPPTLHYKAPNPKIDFANTPFYVVSATRDWENCPLPRRAGVSSFGVGGTNAHVVLEEAPERPPSSASRPQQLFMLSAQSDKALEDAISNMKEALANLDEPNRFADAAFTLNQGRKTFDHRCAFVASDAAEASQVIEQQDPKRLYRLSTRAADPEVVFLFPGQGAQYVNMGKELYQNEPLFRSVVDQCAGLVEPELGLDIRTLLFPESGSESKAKDELTQTVFTQPALFIIMYAQAQLWMSWGIRPAAMVGHSAGEYVAAVLAEVMSLEDALRIIAVRARDMQNLPGGGMLSVRAPEETLQPLLFGSLAISGVNSRLLTVVSGPHDELEQLTGQLAEKKILSKALHTSHAFHSPMMDPMVEPFKEKVSQVALAEARIPIVSSFTGDWIRPGDWTDPAYWANQLRGAVRFADAVSTLVQNPDRILLEVGPGQTLTTLASSNPDRSREQHCLSSMPPIGSPNEQAAMLRALGRLWAAGCQVDWEGFYGDERRRRISLPTYPFQKQKYWIETQVESGDFETDEWEDTNSRIDAEAIIRRQLKTMMTQLDRLSNQKL
jgi:acyl transferase domain-containing protein